MKNAYDREQAALLMPLLHSIAKEIEERSGELVRIESLMQALERHAQAHADALANLRAEDANHKYELRRALSELEHLGCSVSEIETLTIHIPGPNKAAHGFNWRPSEPTRLQELVTRSAKTRT